MEFTCKTSELNKAVQSIMCAVPAKPTTPVFAGMHIMAKGNVIRLETMDITLAMSNEIEAEVTEEGEIIIAAARFAELIRYLEGENVKIFNSKDEESIKLQSGRTNYDILLMNANDYPKFPEISAEKKFILPDSSLSELIKKTAFACSTENTRPLFTGVLCDIENNKVTFVGTNTHRLVIKSLPVEEETESQSLILPATVLKEISKNLDGKLPQEVKIFTQRNQIKVEIGRLTLVSRLIEGKFPDYRRVIPPSFALSSVVNVKELMGAVSRISLCGTATGNAYSIVKFLIGKNEIKITSSSPEIGTGMETVSCSTEGNNEVNVAFNASYIVDMLRNINEDNVVLEVNDSLKPVRIRPEKENDYLYIVTPVRVIF